MKRQDVVDRLNQWFVIDKNPLSFKDDPVDYWYRLVPGESGSPRSPAGLFIPDELRASFRGA